MAARDRAATASDPRWSPVSDPSLPPPPDEPFGAPSAGSPDAGRSPGVAPPSRGYDRVPPHSLEAEVSVLGAALLSRAAANEVAEILRPEDFYRGAHRTVFEAVAALLEASEPIDTVTVTDWLARRDRLDEIGGPAALHDLTVATPTAANAVYYAEIVRQKSLLRRLIDAGTAVARLGFEAVEDAEVVVDQAESLIYEVAQGGATSQYSQLRDLLNDSFAAIEKLAEQGSEVTGLATGFDDLDRLTSGLQPQNLVILAARPAMGKCAWSGTRVLTSEGRVTTIGELVERADPATEILALDDRGSLVPRRVSEFHDNGQRPTYRLRTRSGRSVQLTDNHPLLTWGGWRPLRELTVGERVAVPRRLPVDGTRPRAAAEVVLLAYLLGDGCLRSSQPELTTTSPMIEAEATAAAAAFGGRVSTTIRRGDLKVLRFVRGPQRVTAADVAAASGVSTTTVSAVHGGRSSGSVGTATRRRVERSIADLGFTGSHHPNWLHDWLDELGLWGRGSHDKFIPDPVYTLPRRQLAVFLSRLFATDGTAWVSEEHGYFGIAYSSVSEPLIRGVQHLLLRFGILSRIRDRQVRYLDGTRRAFELEIRDAENVRRFCSEIGIFSKEEQVARVREFADRRAVPHSNTDLLPVEIWDLVLAEKGDRTWAEVSAATGRPRNHNWHVGERCPSRRLVAELAEVFDSDALRDAATSDVLWDEIVAIEPAGVERVYDLTVPGLHNFVADDMVVHNSSLVLNLAQYVSVELKRPAIIFSLEMSKLEIVNRMLSAEARIESTKLRTGKLDDLDWRKLSDALGRLSDAPLFIDDTPSITLMEIRAKCRRLKQRQGLDLVIVDYLQLMNSHGRVDSRQQEVAEFSRGLKMLAKELDVPVIALSQLSRQPEARTDKRPMMSDLRESGCLTRGTRLFRADTGAPITFGQLLDERLRDVPVWSTDVDGRLVAGRLTHAFPSGVKPVRRVRLRSGLTVEATDNHPFRTLDGWTPLEELRVGSRVAAARRLPEPAAPQAMDDDEIVLLAHLLGQGTTVARQPVHYTSADAGNLDAVEKAAWRRFGIEAVRRPDGRSARTTQLYLPAPHRLTHGRRNPIVAWLDELGCWDRRSYEKRLPNEVFQLPDAQLRTFLHHLFATDGSLHVRPEGSTGPKVGLYYATSSPGLAQDLQLLLRRLDLRARVGEYAQRSGRPGFQVALMGAAQQRRFLQEVGFHGERGLLSERAIDVLEGIVSNPNTDVLATDDLAWDEIVAIEPVGEQEVYDATVADHHNFVAEGLILHNSLEQDADIVAFIYRDEVYDEDTPDRGIAELIVSKHRNGATGVVKLAFLNHLTKFANLARGPSGGGGGGGGTPI